MKLVASLIYLPPRMLKVNYILLSLIMLYSCQERVTQRSASLRDSVLQVHLSIVDSIPGYDTSAMDFQILRAYHRNDTAYFAKYLQDKRQWDDYKQKEEFKLFNMYSDSCIHQSSLNETSYEEVYRFKYFQSFCPYRLNVTVGRVNDSAVLQFIIYNPGGDEPFDSAGCRIINQFTKRLSQDQWKAISRAIKYADFWKLKSKSEVHGFDGNNLEVEGYMNERLKVAYPPKYHTVSRWLGEPMAISDAFAVVLKVSGNNEGCYVVK